MSFFCPKVRAVPVLHARHRAARRGAERGAHAQPERAAPAAADRLSTGACGLAPKNDKYMYF